MVRAIRKECTRRKHNFQAATAAPIHGELWVDLSICWHCELPQRQELVSTPAHRKPFVTGRSFQRVRCAIGYHARKKPWASGVRRSFFTLTDVFELPCRRHRLM